MSYFRALAARIHGANREVAPIAQIADTEAAATPAGRVEAKPAAPAGDALRPPAHAVAPPPAAATPPRLPSRAADRAPISHREPKEVEVPPMRLEPRVPAPKPPARSASVAEPARPSADRAPPPVFGAIHAAMQWVAGPDAPPPRAPEVVVPRPLEPAPRATTTPAPGDTPNATGAIEIGTIDVHVHPPTPPSPKRTSKQAPQQGRLSRGFFSSFGLRQSG